MAPERTSGRRTGLINPYDNGTGPVPDADRPAPGAASVRAGVVVAGTVAALAGFAAAGSSAHAADTGLGSDFGDSDVFDGTDVFAATEGAGGTDVFDGTDGSADTDVFTDTSPSSWSASTDLAPTTTGTASDDAGTTGASAEVAPVVDRVTEEGSGTAAEGTTTGDVAVDEDVSAVLADVSAPDPDARVTVAGFAEASTTPTTSTEVVGPAVPVDEVVPVPSVVEPSVPGQGVPRRVVLRSTRTCRRRWRRSSRPILRSSAHRAPIPSPR